MPRKKKEEDIYLTTTFKPLTFSKKVRKNVLKPIFILLIIVGIIAAIGYFLIYPLYFKYIYRNPKEVFTNFIQEVEPIINSYTIDKGNNTKKNIKFNVESNYENLISLNDTNYEIIYGTNNNDSDLIVNNNLNSVNYLKRNSSEYYNYNNDNITNSYKLKDEDNLLYKLNNVLEYDLNNEINEFFSELKNMLNDDRLSYEEETIVILGKDTKVTRNSLKLNKEDVSKLFNYNFKRNIDLVINIYQKNNIFKGIDIEYNGFRIFYYYKDGNKIDAYISLSSIDEKFKNKYNFKGTIENDYINYIVYLNEAEIGYIKVNEYKNSKLSIDYNLKLIKYTVEGNIIIDGNDTKKNIDIKFKHEDKYLYIKATYEVFNKYQLIELNNNKTSNDSKKLQEDFDKFFIDFKYEDLYNHISEYLDDNYFSDKKEEQTNNEDSTNNIEEENDLDEQEQTEEKE